MEFSGSGLSISAVAKISVINSVLLGTSLDLTLKKAHTKSSPRDQHRTSSNEGFTPVPKAVERKSVRVL